MALVQGAHGGHEGDPQALAAPVGDHAAQTRDRTLDVHGEAAVLQEWSTGASPCSLSQVRRAAAGMAALWASAGKAPVRTASPYSRNASTITDPTSTKVLAWRGGAPPSRPSRSCQTCTWPSQPVP